MLFIIRQSKHQAILRFTSSEGEKLFIILTKPVANVKCSDVKKHGRLKIALVMYLGVVGREILGSFNVLDWVCLEA